MQASLLNELVGEMDIYLLDQVMKGHYRENESLLDAGCGTGRNLRWFLLNKLHCYGIDANEAAIGDLLVLYPLIPAGRIQTGNIEKMPFEDNFFDHVISSAVLHFAGNPARFGAMLTEMTRVLKPFGSLFIRMASNIGLETKVTGITDGVYRLPDGSTRFLLTREILSSILAENPLEMTEPLKTVNVNDLRCMTTLVLQKKY